jgi:hypothetical protein
MKSMPITQHTISAVSEIVYEVVNDHSSPKTFSWCKHPFFLKVSRSPIQVNEVNGDNATYFFISLRKCVCGCEQPLFPPKKFWVRTPPVFLKVSWAPSKVNEVDADNAAYYFISLKKIF